MSILRGGHAKFLLGAIVIGGALYFIVPLFLSESYHQGDTQVAQVIQDIPGTEEEKYTTDELPIAAPVTAHLPTPEPLKGLYMTSWVAGTQSMRDHVLALADTTEINAIVFDIKDATGKIAYPVEDPELQKFNASERRIPNLRAFTDLLHSKDIYVIGRIAAFQDPHMVQLHPEYAVKTNTDKTKIWKDRKGISWIDAGEKENWDYLIRIAKDAHAQGVDEVQFDYIRFPSDGNMKDIYFPASNGLSKPDTIRSFWEYVHESLTGTGIVTSADLFGMTANTNNDLGIGQVLEDALVNFDYVSPMVYPSHYPLGWEGYTDPEAYPYETIKISMGKAVERAQAIGVPISKLRPWLQDFSLRQKYGSKEVRAQINATYDVGLTSWMLWDPSTKFTPGALLPE